LSSVLSPFILMLVGQAEDGRETLSDQLLTWRHRHHNNANTLIIDASSEQGLTARYSGVNQEPAYPLSHIAKQAKENPEGSSQWLDCLLAEAPSSKEAPPFDWLCLGSQWQEPEAKVAERLAFSLRRLVKKTYSLVLIDGHSPFLLKTFAGFTLQPLVLCSSAALATLDLEELGLETLLAPTGLLLNQPNEASSLPDSAKLWLKQHERCLLLGKLSGLQAKHPLNEAQEARLQTALLRLQLGHWFS
jgi:hypothetical protein